jgi:hypothetical protein
VLGWVERGYIWLPYGVQVMMGGWAFVGLMIREDTSTSKQRQRG